MSFDREIFNRMDLRQIKSFVLDGAITSECDMSYEERLQKGIDPIYKRLQGLYTDIEAFNEAVVDLYKALNAYEAVYIEIGMKAGARLLNQLLHGESVKG